MPYLYCIKLSHTMATKKFYTVTIVSSGKTGKFTSVNQAHKFLVDNNLTMRETTGFKQSKDIASLSFVGKIRYEETYEEVGIGATGDIKAIIKKEVAEQLKERVVRIDVTNNGKVKNVDGIGHYKFTKVLKAIAARCHVMMAGPAGSGKTTIAHKAADALGLNFFSIPVGA